MTGLISPLDAGVGVGATLIADALTDFDPDGGSGRFWSWTVACGKGDLDPDGMGETLAVSFLLAADMGAGAMAGVLTGIGGLGAIGGTAGAEPGGLGG